MRENLKIFFDMDNVLADFDRGVRELCKIQPLVQEESTEEGSLYRKRLHPHR